MSAPAASPNARWSPRARTAATPGGGRIARFLALALLAGLVTAGCAPGTPDREWAGEVVDSAGIRVVHNPAEGLWCEGEAWSFVEGLTIGAEDGDAAYRFGSLGGIQVAADGSILALDPMAGEVRLFDRTGVHVRTLGARGQGPGEFSRAVAGVFLSENDRIVVPDLGNRRVTWMGLDGALIGSVPVELSSGFPVRWDGDPAGRVVVQRRAMGMNADPVLETGEPLVRIDTLGREETLVVMPRSQVVWMEGAAPRFRYFSTEPSWDLGPDGVLRWGMTQRYRIEVLDPDGTPRMVITKDTHERPLTDADEQRFRALLHGALERAGVSPESIERQLARLELGSTYPAFNQIMEGPDGTTVVQRVATLDELVTLDLAEEMSRRLGDTGWDVFDEAGRYLGVIELPARFSPMAWTSDAVYGRWMDELDRSFVRKLEMVRPVGAAARSDC